MKSPLLLLCFLLAASGVFAQKQKKAPYPSMKSKGTAQSKFLEKQFWLGFKAGVNLSDPLPQARYSVIMPSNYDQSLTSRVA